VSRNTRQLIWRHFDGWWHGRCTSADPTDEMYPPTRSRHLPCVLGGLGLGSTRYCAGAITRVAGEGVPNPG
jgi:hypothetical protein